MWGLFGFNAPFCLLLALPLLLVIVALTYSGRQTRPHLPPSPPGNLLIGHTLRIPADYQWKAFASWGRAYGNLLYLNILGRPMIICNSYESAKELLEKRSHIYSDRPKMISGELLGMKSMMTMLNYGERWRRQRRLMQTSFGQKESDGFRPGIQEEVNKFLIDISHFEGNIRPFVHRLVSKTLCLVAYGHKVTSDDDEIVRLMEYVDETVKLIGNPGSTPVDIFPILRYLPTWIPGLNFPRLFSKGRDVTLKAAQIPLAVSRMERDLGISTRALIPNLLDELDRKDTGNSDDEDVAALGAVTFFAGSETAESVLCTFFLMMVLHPEVTERAHNEIDEFMRSNRRLPSIEDRDQIPFVDCVLKEVYRFHPPAPFGIPHCNAKEDVYQSWTIPSRSMIVTNIWQMLRDEQYFTDPERFDPTRYLDTKERGVQHVPKLAPDPAKVVFGFGRRVCPGRHFADDFMWITIASTLAVFDILPALDPITGNATLPEVEFNSGIISVPKPFSCRIVPRSDFDWSIIREV